MSAEASATGSAASTLDVVTDVILRAKVEAVVDDMSTTLANIAHSSRLSTSRAFAVAVLDADGETVAVDNPLHLASTAQSAASCLDFYEFATSADDVMISNDPYGGGTSVHYFTVVAPLGYEDDIVAYLVVQAHMLDFGGVVRGNYHPAATELWAEGARFTPMKIVVDGKTRRDAMDTLLLNSRDPEGFRGDLHAVVATANIGRQRLLSLIRTYGLAGVTAAMSSSIEYAERRFRAVLQRIPDGSWHGAAALDHDGTDRRDLTIRLSLERTADGMLRLDFSDTDAQSAGFVNSTPSNTLSYAMLPLLGLLGESVPHNAGLLRAIEVITPEGTLVNPAFPAPTGWCREHVGYEIAAAVGQALAQALPEESPLGYASRSLVFTVTKAVQVGGVEEQLDRTDYGALVQVGSPAMASDDGWGQSGPAARAALPSIEEFESRAEASVRRLEYREDSGGPGRSRGGLGTDTVIEFPADSRERLFACVVGRRHRSPGMAQGEPGGSGAVQLAADGSTTEVDGQVFDRTLEGGAELSIAAAGGGGFGDPFQRSPQRVLDDVVAGYVSAEQARDRYGVVIDPDGLTIDERATRGARDGAARGAGEGAKPGNEG